MCLSYLKTSVAFFPPFYIHGSIFLLPNFLYFLFLENLLQKSGSSLFLRTQTPLKICSKLCTLSQKKEHKFKTLQKVSEDPRSKSMIHDPLKPRPTSDEDPTKHSPKTLSKGKRPLKLLQKYIRSKRHFVCDPQLKQSSEFITILQVGMPSVTSPEFYPDSGGSPVYLGNFSTLPLGSGHNKVDPETCLILPCP